MQNENLVGQRANVLLACAAWPRPADRERGAASEKNNGQDRERLETAVDSLPTIYVSVRLTFSREKERERQCLFDDRCCAVCFCYPLNVISMGEHSQLDGVFSSRN